MTPDDNFVQTETGLTETPKHIEIGTLYSPAPQNESKLLKEHFKWGRYQRVEDIPSPQPQLTSTPERK